MSSLELAALVVGRYPIGDFICCLLIIHILATVEVSSILSYLLLRHREILSAIARLKLGNRTVVEQGGVAQHTILTILLLENGFKFPVPNTDMISLLLCAVQRRVQRSIK